MDSIKHNSRGHALLSASGASRWMHCTPSARLEEKQAESKISVYADEGTLAHEVAELLLNFRLKLISAKNYSKELVKLKKHKLYNDEILTFVGKYVEIVLESFKVARQKTSDAKLLVEQQLDFSHIVEQGFGTGDSAIVGDGEAEIIDLKYGKGVAVDATENPQLMLYGLGALNALELMYDIHTIKLTVVQPRLDNYSSYVISVEDLKAWAVNKVMPAAKLAYAGEGKQVAGNWCKFCKVKGFCRAIAKQNIELAKYDFLDPHLLSDKELLAIHEQIPMLTDWAAGVNAHILQTAIEGKKWLGYKIVEGKSNRKWLDEAKAKGILVLEGHKPENFETTSLKGIAAIETLVGKSKFPALLGEFVVKPQGAPTLVPESDKRTAIGINQAKIDFANDETITNNISAIELF